MKRKVLAVLFATALTAGMLPDAEAQTVLLKKQTRRKNLWRKKPQKDRQA